MEALLPVAERSRRGPARAHVYTALRDAIVAGQLEPGRQISENELAARLGVSRTPIREALQRLREERLVAVVPQYGTFVTHISESAVSDAQFVREALECAAIRGTALRARDQDLAALEAIIRRQDAAREANDFDSFYVLDDELHQLLCDLSGHDIAWSLSQRAKGHLNRIRRLSMPEPGYMMEMIGEHRAVVAAVAAHDPDEAEQTLRHHLRMVLSTLPAIREQHPDYFEEEIA
ncbi:MAG TPA: GntR family transcriptional regulator [Solirubrobacteraceae bacterium]|nr:GntR family transcriptional regulator [Solirubrobacteraceae bacterium]